MVVWTAKLKANYRYGDVNVIDRSVHSIQDSARTIGSVIASIEMS